MTEAASILAQVKEAAVSIKTLERWLAAPHIHVVSESAIQSYKNAAADLDHLMQQLQADPALLTIVFVGGTGVGKSTLLNAIAGASVAESGLARPTTRVPVVYHHREVNTERLDPAFKDCRAVAHDRAELRQKVLVDTPDVDGAVIENHERLLQMLPAANAVLYVGSQEKYHDQAVWDVLLKNRGSRGFAFVLNKWDRCKLADDERTGRRPDEDFRASLYEAGFESPLLFRTCGKHWARQRVAGNGNPTECDDDFLALEEWIESGLSDLVIAAIKARGLAGTIERIIRAIESLAPADYSRPQALLVEDWNDALRSATKEQVELLVHAADAYAAAFERYFSQFGRSEFRGVFGTYLKGLDLASRLNLSVMSPLGAKRSMPIGDLVDRCVAAIPFQTRISQQSALRDRLLALADRRDWPVNALSGFLARNQDEREDNETLANLLREELTRLERDYSEPKGAARSIRLLVRWLCHWTPYAVLLLLAGKCMYDAWYGSLWGLGSLFLAGLAFFASLLVLHWLLTLVVPVRWDSLRAKLQAMIEGRILERTTPAYHAAVDRFVAATNAERAEPLAAVAVARKLHQTVEASVNRSRPQTDALFSRSPAASGD